MERTTPNWSVLPECGQEPLQFYWFWAAARFYNALLRSNSDKQAKVLKADIAMSAVNKKCWSAEFLDALRGGKPEGSSRTRVAWSDMRLPLVFWRSGVRLRSDALVGIYSGNTSFLPSFLTWAGKE